MIPLKSKIILGVSENSDVVKLLEEGYRQFYMGYVPLFWSEQFGYEKSPNRRQAKSAQITTKESLQNLIKTIQSNGGKIYLALNTPYVVSSTTLYISKIAQEYIGLNPDGIIVGSIESCKILQNLGYENIVASNVFGIYSRSDASFLLDMYKVKKIILPRDITLKEIQTIVTNFKEVEFEVFLGGVLSDMCRFSEANCQVEHGYRSVLGGARLCDYTMSEKIYFSKEQLDFRKLLKKDASSLDIQNYSLSFLISSFERGCIKEDLTTIETVTKMLLSIDFVSFLQENEELFFRLQMILKSCDFPQKAFIEEKLLNYEPSNNYDKTNSYATQKAIEFFSNYKNITSYKLPARGKNIETIFQSLQSSQNYKKRESLYLLWNCI